VRVFVTGGSGFIGSNVVDVLLEGGDQVLNYDLKAPSFSRHGSYWYEGDVLDARRLESSLSSFAPDAVIHLAAWADINAHEWQDFAAIHEGTRNLRDAVDRYGKLDRLVNVSTQLVIGPNYSPRSLLDYRPYTAYGEAKAFAEALFLQWRSPVHWLTVRPANIWGPHHPGFAKAIWKYIDQRVYLHPDTREPVVRSYGYVRNTAEQMVALMRCDPSETDRQVFYLADSVLDSAIWVDAFAVALTGKSARRMKLPILRAMGWGGDIAARCGVRTPIDSGRVMRMTHSYPVPLDQTLALTGTPRITLQEGVAKTVHWLRASSIAKAGTV
jgi:nucleoside-diphosphate-sugar epimerase